MVILDEIMVSHFLGNRDDRGIRRPTGCVVLAAWCLVVGCSVLSVVGCRLSGGILGARLSDGRDD